LSIYEAQIQSTQSAAPWFAAHLLDGGRYSGVFELVSFAVLDRKDDGTFAAFNRVFRAG
jgi:hypothetical protein